VASRLTALAVLTTAVLAAAAPAQPLATAPVLLGGVAHRLELAADPAARERGLSGRTSIEPTGGMLFVFPDEGPRQFWMRDCLVDIDIAFLDGRGRIVAVHRMKAEPARRPGETEDQYLGRLRGYPSFAPARYAIELRAGSLVARRLAVGGSVDLAGIALPRE
jgi:uncharacterized membrane protein (UPF0127 family)